LGLLLFLVTVFVIVSASISVQNFAVAVVRIFYRKNTQQIV